MNKGQKPLTYMVYEKVYADIINGVVNSNDILTECALIDRFKVSKSPVREALIMLCEEEVLKAIPRTGYKVIQITPGQIEQQTEARMALELFMLRKSWDLMDETRIAELEAHWALAKEDERIHTTAQENWRRNYEFHMMLASYAGNDYLLAMLARMLKACGRAAAQYYLYVHRIPKGEADLHNELLLAMRERDLDKALDIITRDIKQIV